VSSEAGLNLGSTLLSDLGTPDTDISLLRRGIHEALAVRTAAAAAAHSSSSSSSSASDAAAAASTPSSGEALHSLSSIDGASSSNGLSQALSLGASLEGHGASGSGGGEQDQKKKKKKSKKDPVEMFVLDGRLAYGLKAAQAAAAASRPTSTDPLPERPCSDCPLIRDAGWLEGPPTTATTAAAGVNGSSSAEGGAGQHLGNGSAASVPASAAVVASGGAESATAVTASAGGGGAGSTGAGSA